MVSDLAGLLRALVDCEVRFVVIGGIAVAAHRVVRATEDVDIVPDPDPENLARLFELLVDADATLVKNPERGMDAGVRKSLAEGRNLTVTTRLGDLDVVQRLAGVPAFDELDRDAWDATLFDVTFRVCSREHLVAMKRAGGRQQDLADLERLAE